MRYRKIGDTDASVIGFGAWAIGGWMWGGADEADAIAAIHAALDAGINLLDTAPIYGFGVSEQIVGKAIADRRDEVYLASKCGMVWGPEFEGKGRLRFYADEQRINNEGGDINVQIYLRPESLQRELDASLQRLNVDCIDLYQTHWQEHTTPVEETMGWLEEMRAAGKIRHIGCCNAELADMDRYRAAGTLDSDQEPYSMVDRDTESTHLAYCADHGIALLAYSPMARGLLTGRCGPDREFDEGDQRAHNDRFSVDNRRRVQAMLEDMRPVAEELDLSFAQLSVAWALAQRGCSHALVGARNPQQVAENAKAGAVTLSDDQVARLNAALDAHGGEIG